MPATNRALEALPPLALYVHIPWCARKCPYCDFNSHELRQDLPEEPYVQALLADLEQELPDAGGRGLTSIFIGGGTPSLLSAEAVDRLLRGVRALVAAPSDIEVTLEANPGTVDAARLAGFRAAGVNRLSIGIQSFQPELLQRIGRIHGRAEAIGAVAAARRAGFENINIDLMFGLPGETVSQALADMGTALALTPEHISFYQLTLEPNTWFHRCPPELPEDEAVWEMQQRCQESLAAAGYEQYEVSAYARSWRACRHNLNYWLFGDYLGIGAGAHGKLSTSERIVRRWKLKHPQAYLRTACSADRVGGESTLTPADAAFEFMLNALRLKHGFPARLFPERTGVPLRVLAGALAQAEARDLLRREGDRVWATETGFRYLNDLLELFLPDGADTAGAHAPDISKAGPRPVAGS